MAETPSVYWPDHSVEFGFTFGLSFNTIETRLSNRRRQARLLDPRPQRTLEGRVPTITWNSSEEIRSFITARGGNFEPFWIYAWMRQQFTKFPVGTGDGIATDFVIPFMYDGLTATNVKVAEGVAGFVIGDAGGGGHQAFLRLDDPPLADDLIIADIIGRERIPVVLNGNVLHVEHPLHRHQGASGPADFYSIPVIEVF
jgi:hypothetical protein